MLHRMEIRLEAMIVAKVKREKLELLRHLSESLFVVQSDLGTSVFPFPDRDSEALLIVALFIVLKFF